MTRHTHPHNHAHSYNNAFFISILANGLFVIVQIIYSSIAHSSSLLADALHNLGDVVGLVLAWVAMQLMQKKPTAYATYGMKKTSILAALINGALLVFSCGIIAVEAISQFILAPEVHTPSVIAVAGIGILVNGITALLFLKGSDDLNIRAAFLHLLYDAFISMGVVVSSGVIYFTHWYWIDPLVGLLIAIVLLKGAWKLFASSFSLIIDGVPHAISLEEVSHFLLSKTGVKGVHDLHVWAMSTQENAMSVHVCMPDEQLTDSERVQWVSELNQKFGISHVTIQVERTTIDCNDNCHKNY